MTSSSPPINRREQILDAALRLANRDGLEGLTVRNLCDEVGVTAPVIYRQFADKEAIVHALVERLLGTKSVPEADENVDPFHWLAGTFLAIRRSFLAHPQLLPLTQRMDTLLERSLQVADVVLAVLERAGLEPMQRGAAFHTMMAFTIGSSLMARGTGAADNQVTELIMRYPRVLSAGPSLDPRQESVFVRGFEGVLRGFGITPKDQAPAP